MQASNVRVSAPDVASMLMMRSLLDNEQGCGIVEAEELWLSALQEFIADTEPYLSSSALVSIWDRLTRSACMESATVKVRAWLEFLRLSAARSDAQLVLAGAPLLPSSGTIADTPANRLLLAHLMSAYIRQGNMEDALALWKRSVNPGAKVEIRALAAYAYANSR